jgi:rhodanese-related sulfurtransferase
MNPRVKLTVTLLCLGLLLAFLPLRSTRSLSASPDGVSKEILSPGSFLTVDQLARLIASEDSTIHLIDLRKMDEYLKFSIPGAVNVPWKEFTGRDPETFLLKGNFKNIFYSNGDLISNYAVVIATGLGYPNCYSVRGGMNDWIVTVMNSKFSGERISARENALFEARTKAARLFTEMNSLPDSLKVKYLNSMKFNPKKLDGGCE